MSLENWVHVEGYVGLYEVSDQGRVRSLDRTVECRPGVFRSAKGRVLAASSKDPVGHPGVSLSHHGIARLRRVHHLVLEAFVGPCPPGMEGCHGNGIPDDNRLSNLRWDTRRANAQDRLRHGRDQNLRKTHCPHDHPYAGDNLIVEVLPTGKVQRACRSCKKARNDARPRKTARQVEVLS